MKTLGIIPARYASTRFPAKALVDIGGKTMLQRVYEQAQKASLIDEVIIATDDQRIYEHTQTFSGKAEMTALSHQSGTDRCAEVAARHPEFDLVINIQGDEPFIDPKQIDKVVKPLKENLEVQISTLAILLQEKAAIFNPNVVKVLFSKQKKALYFSRSTIPHLRGVDEKDWLEKGTFYKHIGLYGFRRRILEEVAKLERGSLEEMEALEQLRWLENDYTIAVELTDQETIGIDTPEDLEKALKYLA